MKFFTKDKFLRKNIQLLEDTEKEKTKTTNFATIMRDTMKNCVAIFDSLILRTFMRQYCSFSSGITIKQKLSKNLAEIKAP